MTLIRPLCHHTVGSGSLQLTRGISEYPLKSASAPAFDRPPLVTLTFDLQVHGG